LTPQLTHITMPSNLLSLKNEVEETLRMAHDCWRGMRCRDGEENQGEYTYEPDSDEIEEYLLENAEDFEVEEVTDEPAEAVA
jgi:hypothetical protein